jgi:hypothetical protein
VGHPVEPAEVEGLGEVLVGPDQVVEGVVHPLTLGRVACRW